MTVQTIFFNKIYVIESLNPSERQTGTNLYKDLLRFKIDNLNNFSSELITINRKEDFEKTMEDICANINLVFSRPYLHFEIHGSKDGLVLNNLELVSWEELYDHFQKINSVLKNQLFISLATCFGAYLFNAIDPTKRSPFFGFVGNTSEVTSYDIEVGFSEYFNVLLETFDLTEAIEALNKSNRELQNPFVTMASEEIFQFVSGKLIAQSNSRPFMLAKRKELVKRAMQDANIKSRYTKAELNMKMKERLKNRNKDLKILEDYFLFKRDSAAL